MTAILLIGAKALWCGCAALGFGVLFNAPKRSWLPIAIGGILAGLVKFALMYPGVDAGVVLASFLAASAVGMASIPMAHLSHVSPMIFAIPSVIPLVPGAFAYRTMLGLMRLTGEITAEYPDILSQTVHNGAKTLFVIMALALGVAIPMHVMRKESVKNLRLVKGK